MTFPVGTVRIRTRHKRGGDKRAWIKIAAPNKWELRARVIWENTNAPIPRGMGIHHKDEDTLNDTIVNLELVSKRDHLAIHRPAFHDRAINGFVRARRLLRWSTKSLTKRTGRPPRYTTDQLTAALAAMNKGMTVHAAAALYGVSRSTLYRRHRGTR